MDDRRVRVVVVDDSPVIRSQLRNLLDAEPDLDVVGTGWSGMEALRLVHQLEPDVLVVDQDMSDIRGTEIAAHLGTAGMAIRVVVYTIGDLPEGRGPDPHIQQPILDDESVGALMTAVRRPPADRTATRAN